MFKSFSHSPLSMFKAKICNSNITFSENNNHLEDFVGAMLPCFKIKRDQNYRTRTPHQDLVKKENTAF